MIALLDASIADGAFSLARFGERGLGACNPLLAFQLMNNFTLCHGAILEGLGGPNGALFSRGAGTTAALIEAVHAIRAGDCERAIAGGADSAIAPGDARRARARRLPRARPRARRRVRGLVALAVGRRPARRRSSGCGDRERRHECLARPSTAAPSHGAIVRGRDGARPASRRSTGDVDLVVLAPWGPPAGDALRTWARPRRRGRRRRRLRRRSATRSPPTPALAWVAALDLLARAARRRALVLGAGIDGDVGAVVLAEAPRERAA